MNPLAAFVQQGGLLFWGSKAAHIFRFKADFPL